MILDEKFELEKFPWQLETIASDRELEQELVGHPEDHVSLSFHAK